jgi:hypothetical protein
MNVPLGIAAFLLAKRALRSITFEPRPHRIDYAGATLLAGVLSSVMVALTLLGQGQGLFSTATLGLLGLGVALLVVLVLQEKQAAEPLLPPELFRNRVVVTCCAVLAFQFFVMLGGTVLLPLAMQSLGRADANEVALRMLPMTLATPLGAFTAGRVMYLTARYRASVLAGTPITALAAASLAWLGIEAIYRTSVLMAFLGFGLGLTMPPSLVAAQMAVAPRQIGVVTSTTALFRTLGGAIGIAVLTSILFAQLRAAPAGPAGSGTSARPVLDALTGAAPAVLREAFFLVFAVAAASALGALLLALTLPAKRLKQEGGEASAGEE